MSEKEVIMSSDNLKDHAESLQTLNEIVEKLPPLFENQEYETQFFGFTPKSVSDSLYNAIMDYAYEILTTSVSSLKSQGLKAREDVTDEVLKEAVANIYMSLGPTVDRTIDKLEHYLTENIFNIPSHVLLNEDKLHELHPSKYEEVLQLEGNITDLEKKIEEIKFLNACLRNELLESEPILAELDEVLRMQEQSESRNVYSVEDSVKKLNSVAQEEKKRRMNESSTVGLNNYHLLNDKDTSTAETHILPVEMLTGVQLQGVVASHK